MSDRHDKERETEQGQDREQQDVLDQLVSNGQALPVDGNEYIPLYKSLGSSPAYLPSNFSHLVMQKVIQLKVERARSSAVSLSVLVSVLASLFGAGLLALYALYSHSPVISVSTVLNSRSLMLPIAAGVVLLILVVFDGFFNAVRHRLRE